MFCNLFTLCLFFLFALNFNAASKFSLKKPSSSTAIKSQASGASKIAADSAQEESLTCNSLLPEEPKRRSLDSLTDSILYIILEHFIDDYKTMRLVSKNFSKAFDDLIYFKCLRKFPGLTKEIFSHWNLEDSGKKNEHLKYQLILLFRVLKSNIKLYILLLCVFYSNIVLLIDCYEQSLDFTTNYYLRLNAEPFVTLIPSEFLNSRLELTNVFLKFKLVTWASICHLLFSDNKSISQIWPLGLTTMAREMATFDADAFLESVGLTGKGLLKAVRAGKYDLSRFIIHFMRSRSHQFKNEEIIYLNLVFEELIEARYWDLLQEIYEMNRIHVFPYHLETIVENGYVEGLRVLSQPAKTEAPKMTSSAAKKGHLEFLQKMDALGLLQESCYLAIHVAAANGQIECLEFLVSRLGTKYLGFVDDKGDMPIHLAAQRFDSETLRAIIRLYPHYKPLSSTKFGVKSPLHEAIRKSIRANIRILLDTFPKLIKFKDDFRYTVIHLAMNDCDDDLLLRELLELAPPKIITAKNIFGQTALHMGQDLSNYFEKVELLMKTGLFTGTERHDAGLTPIASFIRNLDWKSASTRSRMMESFQLKSEEELKSKLMKIFKLKSEKKFKKALKIKY